MESQRRRKNEENMDVNADIKKKALLLLLCIFECRIYLCSDDVGGLFILLFVYTT